jgi:hypothetical protein
MVIQKPLIVMIKRPFAFGEISAIIAIIIRMMIIIANAQAILNARDR